MTTPERITRLKAELYDLSQRHAAHLGQAQQHQHAAAEVERECLKRQGQIDMLLSDAAEPEAKQD